MLSGGAENAPAELLGDDVSSILRWESTTLDLNGGGVAWWRNGCCPPPRVREVGLAGEVRGIPQAGLRVREAAQMGFERCIMPEANIDPADRGRPSGPCALIGVRTVGEALDALLG